MRTWKTSRDQCEAITLNVFANRLTCPTCKLIPDAIQDGHEVAPHHMVADVTYFITTVPGMGTAFTHLPLAFSTWSACTLSCQRMVKHCRNHHLSYLGQRPALVVPRS